jgi:hypothetical protein
MNAFGMSQMGYQVFRAFSRASLDIATLVSWFQLETSDVMFA